MSMTQDAFRFSGEAAANYDKYLGPILFEPLAKHLVSGIDRSGINDILEIAAGTGRVTAHLRKHFGDNVRLVASDLNADMLEVAKQKLGIEGVEFRQEDAQNLSFADGSFDLVICQFGLMFLPDKKKGIREAMRVLRPGGLFLWSTWDSTENIPLLKIVFNDVILPLFENEDLSRFLIPFSLYDDVLLKTWMKEENFHDIQADKVTLESGCRAPENIVDGFFIKHSLGAEVQSKNPASLEKTARIMKEKISGAFGSRDLKFDLTAFVISGRKASRPIAP